MVIADVQSNIWSSAAAIPLMVIDCLDADLPLQIRRAMLSLRSIFVFVPAYPQLE